MGKLFSSPIKVYMAMGVLCLLGIYSAFKLPVDLFPHSSKPSIVARVQLSGMTPESFYELYGSTIESRLQRIDVAGADAIAIQAEYHADNAQFSVDFKWGDDGDIALKETRQIMNELSVQWPEDMQKGFWVWKKQRGSAFYFAQIYSEELDNTTLFQLLQSKLVPKLSKVEGADIMEVWNPDKRQVMIEMDPLEMAQMKLKPRDVISAVKQYKKEYAGGVYQSGHNNVLIQIPKSLHSIEDIKDVIIPIGKNDGVYLGQIAKVFFVSSSIENNINKVDGHKTVGLYLTPKSGGNLNQVIGEVTDALKEVLPQIPGKVNYMDVVNPSVFISEATQNVVHEVFLSAALAVLVLFLFMGNLRNTATATLEIPLSIILAFILMHLTGVELNLISLSGLALSTGMNVDASIVVMENIFRHFQGKPAGLSYQEKLTITINAVKEVLGPVISATIASLVVFLPLAFTSDLTYAVLGDLAKAVVYSHGLSAFIALILVPTIRLHLLSTTWGEKLFLQEDRPTGFFYYMNEGIQKVYVNCLQFFIRKTALKWGVVFGVLVLIVWSFWFIPGKLKKELIGKPDTSIIWTHMSKNANTHMSEMEDHVAQFEAKSKNLFPEEIEFSYAQIYNPTSAGVALMLGNKKDMERVQKKLKEVFTNGPDNSYHISTFNPAQMPLPDPPDMSLVVRGPDHQLNFDVAREFQYMMRQEDVFDRYWYYPNLSRKETIKIDLIKDKWAHLNRSGVDLRPDDIAQMVRLSNKPYNVDYLFENNQKQKIYIRYKEGGLKSTHDIAAFPVGIQDKVVPMSALAQVKKEIAPPEIYNEDLMTLVRIEAREPKHDLDKDAALEKIKVAFERFKKERLPELDPKNLVSFEFEDPHVELNKAVKELSVAVLIALGLIFITLLLQFGSIAHTLFVMLAIPFGFLGILLALYLGGSTLSLNSALGAILLNGIAVANSIMLVDVMQEYMKKGFSPLEAALQAARKRIRPILMTSLTTILGMLPIALGLGEGGKIIQPLGIAICGGLWVSLVFTLFIVPALEVTYGEWRASKAS